MLCHVWLWRHILRNSAGPDNAPDPFSTLQTLLRNLSVCDSRRSPTSASLLSLFRGNDVKAFKTAAIEDDAGTKTASDGALSDRILRQWLARRWNSHLYRV